MRQTPQSRNQSLKPVTSLKELQTLRQFFGFCFDRRWIGENIAKRIKGPRNIKPNDVEPYAPNEMTRILAACDSFGRGAYERASWSPLAWAQIGHTRKKPP